MSKLLDGEVALVTGGSRGIGRQIAAVLGGAGATVIADLMVSYLDQAQKIRGDRTGGLRW